MIILSSFDQAERRGQDGSRREGARRSQTRKRSVGQTEKNKSYRVHTPKASEASADYSRRHTTVHAVFGNKRHIVLLHRVVQVGRSHGRYAPIWHHFVVARYGAHDLLFDVTGGESGPQSAPPGRSRRHGCVQLWSCASRSMWSKRFTALFQHHQNRYFRKFEISNILLLFVRARAESGSTTPRLFVP